MADQRPAIGTLMLRVLDYLSSVRSFTLAVLSPDLVIVEVTEKFREFQAKLPFPAIGRHVTESIWELVGCEDGLREVLKGEADLFNLENINRTLASSSTAYISITVLPMIKEKPGEGLLLIIEGTTLTSTLEQQLVQDRNELRLTKRSLSTANDELQKLNRLKSLFLSIAAHDLRSPLTAMRGYTALALGALPKEAKPEVGEYLSIVQSLVDTQSRLISDFLDVDIIEQGNLKIRPRLFELNPTVLKVSDVMASIAKRKQVHILTNLDEHLPQVYGDPDRIQQILFNLIGNAIKYTNEGDQIEVETKGMMDQVEISVADHGPGIPESEIPRLFELYHRTDNARESRVKGLGLGLFIVKSMVDLHNGQVAVESEMGKGSKFKVSLPMQQSKTGGDS